MRDICKQVEYIQYKRNTNKTRGRHAIPKAHIEDQVEITSIIIIAMSRGMDCGAVVKEADTPGRHPQSCLAGLKS